MKKLIAIACASLLFACANEQEIGKINTTALDNDSVVIPDSLSVEPRKGNDSSKVEEQLIKKYAKLLKLDCSSLRPKAQIFTINPGEDNYIYTKGGAEFFIPKNAFIKENGDPVTEKVEFRVTEYNKASEFMSEQLVTQTTSEDILTSGGMFNLEANSEGESLKLKDYKDILVHKRTIDDEMKIYRGVRAENGSMQWEVDPNSTQPYPTMVCANGKYCDLSKNFFEDNFRFEKELMLSLMDSSLEYNLSFGNNAEIIGRTTCASKIKARDRACKRFLKVAENLGDSIPNVFNNSWKTTFRFRVMNYNSYEQFFRKRHEARIEAARKIQDKRLVKALKKVVLQKNKAKEFYNNDQKLFIGNLGFCNIDRTINLTRKQQENQLIVEGATEKTHVALLFDNNSSYLTGQAITGGNFTRFSRTPKGKKAILFCSFVEGKKHVLLHQQIILQKNQRISISSLKREEYDSIDALANKIDSWKEQY